MRAASMLEKAKELAVILCFDVPVDKEAEKVADELGIKIFKADIIYHLFDAFTAYNAAIVEAKRVDSAPRAVFPCRLKIIQCFAKRDRCVLLHTSLPRFLRVGRSRFATLFFSDHYRLRHHRGHSPSGHSAVCREDRP